MQSSRPALNAIDGKKLGKLDIKDEASARAIEQAVKGQPFKVDAIESKPAKRHPYPPFRTSTLQQEASRKLGFSSSRTMQIAQRLYEGVDIGGETVGLITYMRTDGVDMAPEAIAATRNAILKNFGEPYLPSVPRHYTTKAKNAQEAHEAIRPTELSRHPAQVRKTLDDDQFALYELIWKRTIASQMESAELERTTADIGTQGRDGKHYSFRANGSVVKFDGFLKVYFESLDDEEDEDSRRLPAMARGDSIGVKKTRRRPAFHRAAAALFGSLAHQEAGRTRHRPALDLCLDPRDAARPRLYPHRQEAPHPGRQGPRRHRLPRKLLPALCGV